ncbi:MAG: radical SAM protein [Candidatus Micrarchaeia archaeon]|jgi:MoaA/NifB/PqqE/SkfB family radical SAM enzyme
MAGLKKLPPTAVWDATDRCLMDCKFCFADRFAKKSTELSTTNAKKLVSSLARRGVKVLVFSGGDPLCRTDLAQLLKYAKGLGLKTIVHTTGMAPRAALERILPFAGRINLPLDGGRKVHAAVRGHPGHFDAVVSTLQFLRGKNVPASVTTMVSKKNASGILGIAKILRRFPNVVLWRCLEFRPLFRAKNFASEFALEKGVFAGVRRDVEAFAKRAGWKARMEFVPARRGAFDRGFVPVSSKGKIVES